MARNETPMLPRRVKVKLTSIAPYSASRMVTEPRIGKEKPEVWDRRTWHLKANVDDEGNCIIPAVAFKFAMINAAKYCNIKIEGGGGSKFTKHFTSGLTVESSIKLGVTQKEIASQPDRYSKTYMMNAKGVRGPGSRVPRVLPFFEQWQGEIEMIVLDPIIDKKVFAEVMHAAGNYIGVGQYRPENGGDCGRFMVEKIEWMGS